MTEPWQSLAHSRWECKSQVVFVPKDRRKAVYGESRASSVSRSANVMPGFAGLKMTATSASPGINSVKSCRCLMTVSDIATVIPVTLPPGCANVVTSPSSTG